MYFNDYIYTLNTVSTLPAACFNYNSSSLTNLNYFIESEIKGSFVKTNSIFRYIQLVPLLIKPAKILFFFLILKLILSILFFKKTGFYFKKYSTVGYENIMLQKDFVIILSIIALTTASLFLLIPKIFISKVGNYYFICINILLIISITTQLPIIFLLNTGVLSLSYLKGFVGKKSKLRSVIEDLFSTSTFLFRYLLQSMRWLMISVSMFMLSESFFYKINLKSWFYTHNTYLTHTHIIDLVLVITQLLFEYIDLLFMLCVQVSAFITLLF